MRHIRVACFAVLMATGASWASDGGMPGAAGLKPVIDLAQARTYILGPRGGCYYINRNGNRTYVDRSFCRR